MGTAGGKGPPLLTPVVARGKGFFPLQLSTAPTLLKAEEGHGASRLLHSMASKPMASEAAAQLGQVRQTTTLHFSVQVQRKNHSCRSEEPKSLLAAQCLGVKFYSQLS